MHRLLAWSLSRCGPTLQPRAELAPDLRTCPCVNDFTLCLNTSTEAIRDTWKAFTTSAGPLLQLCSNE